MKKSVIFISISLGLIILLGIGVSYSMWNISVSQDTTNLAESKCFDLSITNKENNISLDNAYPISNDKGKSLTPYTFTITNTCDITAQYNINLEVLNSSTLSSKFIDVMFEGNINLLSNYDSTDKVNTSSIESRKLTTGILKSQESKDYSLRLWLDYNTTLEDLNNDIKTFKSKIVVVGKPINYTGDTVFDFDYTGGEQTFIAPVSGTYKLETWGAQGNASLNGQGGYGGYSNGNIKLTADSEIFINVGGSGASGAYNNYLPNVSSSLKGGGATHIASVSGNLYLLSGYISDIFIISGGGGAGERENGGSGGGYIGGSGYPIKNTHPYFATGGTQTNGGTGFEVSENLKVYSLDGSFGTGGNGKSSNDSGPGGGSGLYGGGATTYAGGAGGGSGYIGNPFLINKVMYCYNCEESNEESTKTISTTCNEETPTSNCAKKGNGYARITLVSTDE